MTQLARPAKGLPRYYMDCGWHRHPRFAGLEADVLFVFDQIVAYSTQHQLDGLVPSDPETLAMAVGIKVPTVRKALPKLIERDALIDKGHEVYVRNWGEHNPTSAEVDDRAKERSESGTRGNHIRWHLNKNIVDTECKFCMEGDDGDPFSSQ